MSISNDFDGWIAAAEPATDELDRGWVRARVAGALFRDSQLQAPTVGRFELGDRLGVGGMGVVYAARDPELDRDVAIKLIRVNAPDDRAETHAEAQALARVTHPNVVAVHDVGIVEDQVYIVMEFVRGTTLREYAKEASERDIVEAYRQATRGLAIAHDAGLIHRDFKPDNALIGEDGRVRVIDFGLAHEDRAAATAPTAGTPKYMAPEQARGGELSAAVDQYAVCVSLREALAAADAPLPAWLETIISRGESEAPVDRFASLEELDAALGRDPRAVRRGRLIGGGVGVAVAGAFAIGATVFAGGDPAPSCTGGASAMEAAWPSERRSAALEQVEATSDYGASLAPRLEAWLGSFRDRWAATHRQVCLAHERGERSADMLDSQMACLDRAKRSLSAAATLVEAASDTELAGLAVAARSLPEPEACDRVDSLETDAPPANVAADVAALSERAADIRVLLSAGRFARARSEAKALHQKAAATAHSPIIAELKLLEGTAALWLFDLEAAVAPLKEATEIALSKGLNALAVEGWARLSWVHGERGNKRAALDGRGLVIALAKQLGNDHFATGLLYTNIGGTETALGNRTGARQMLARAVEVARQVRGPGAIELVSARVNLAIVAVDEAARLALADEAIAALTELVGADHPQTLMVVVHKARMTSDVALGRSLLETTCPALAALHPTLKANIGECFLELAWFRALDGDQAKAGAAMARAASVHPHRARLNALALGLKRDPGAGAALDALLSEDLPADALWWMVWQRAELELVRALWLAQRERPGAAQQLEAALQTLESIEDRLPLIRLRIRVARRWLKE